MRSNHIPQLAGSLLLSALGHLGILSLPGSAINSNGAHAPVPLNVWLAVSVPSSPTPSPATQKETPASLPTAPKPRPFPGNKSTPTHQGRTIPTINPDDYLPRSRLDQPPIPLGEINPQPPALAMPGLVGQADLLVLINERGKVDAVLVQNSSLPAVMTDFAASTFRETAFKPGLIANQPVKSRIRIRLEPPQDGASAPSSVRSRAWNPPR